MKQEKNKEEIEESIFLKCDCHAEAIEIHYWKDDEEFYLSFWDIGRSKVSWIPWRKRFEMIWRILKGKDLYADMVILNKEKAKELVSFINHKLK
jgi:hypothetical protein